MRKKKTTSGSKKAPDKRRKRSLGELGAVYVPAAKTRSMKVETPDSMAAETVIAQTELRQYLEANFGKSMTVEEYVRRKLAYPTMQQLEDSLFAEQIDGVALAIYNIEAKNQGIIIGDQTGIGKGRQAAAIIRYAILRGKTPIFFTEKPNLFSDIYRDLIGIGSEDGNQIKKRRNQSAEKEWDELTEDEQAQYDNLPENYEAYLKDKGVKKVAVFSENRDYDLSNGVHVVPFIVNARELKSSIKDVDGNILYEAPEKAEQESVFASFELPPIYNLIMLTYSQIASGNKVGYEGSAKKVTYGKKAQFVVNLAKDNIVILDEAHNASGGDSSTGIIVRDLLQQSEGTVFLSGTFAKRPENMALYAQKTAVGDVNSTAEGLAEAIQVGGVAMQEWVSSIFVKEGQMIRRERGMENSGAVINWITLDETAAAWGLPDLKTLQRQTVDKITAVIRLIIRFQTQHVGSVVKEMDRDLKEEQGEVGINQGTRGAGVDNVPYFSKVFNVINQLLFSTKAEAVAMHALHRLKQDKKVVIAFANTMGSFISELTEEGLEDRDGGTRIKTDFALVLEKALKSVLKIQISNGWGKKQFRSLTMSELSLQGQEEYRRIQEVIRQTTTDILVSPIDVMKHIISSHGYSIAEVTGRDKEVRFDKPSLGRMSTTADMKTGVVVRRPKEDAAAAFRRFQNNEVDVLFINQSGATGASAQAIPTLMVPASKVKQRVMIIAQPELDVNIEVQKWGRINRTGQILPPVYDYIVSAIPAEQRPVMMLQNKLNSLFANTTSSQKSGKDILQSGDFLNKIGDRVVKEYVEVEREENGKESIYTLCDLKKWMSSDEHVDELAKKVAGRVAIIPTARQQQFYDEVTETYRKEVERLINAGEYDLEVETLNLNATLISEDMLVGGKPEAKSEFGKRSMLSLFEINNLSKPYTFEKVKQLLHERIPEGMNGNYVAQVQRQQANDFLTQQKMQRLQQLRTDFEEDSNVLNARIQKAKTAEKAEGHKVALDNLKVEFEKDYILRETKENELIAQVTGMIGYFYPGRLLIDGVGGEDHMVCLGVKLNDKAKNPYSLSKVYIEFAVASSTRRLSLNLARSGSYMLKVIQEHNDRNRYLTNRTMVDFWEKGVKNVSADRIRSYIITGNLLQAMAQETFRTTRIIDFTKDDGTTQKGLLVPYSVLPPPEAGSNRKVIKLIPFSQCARIIQNLYQGQFIGTDKMTVFGPDNNYRVLVPASKAKGGDFYTDKGLLALVKDHNFIKSGDKMGAYILPGKLEEFCGYVSNRFGLSCQVSTAQAASLMPEKHPTMEDFKSVIMGFEPFPPMPKIPVPAPAPPVEDTGRERRKKLMAIKAKALTLKLKLLQL